MRPAWWNAQCCVKVAFWACNKFSTLLLPSEYVVVSKQSFFNEKNRLKTITTLIIYTIIIR